MISLIPMKPTVTNLTTLVWFGTPCDMCTVVVVGGGGVALHDLCLSPLVCACEALSRRVATKEKVV
jgi:hypothetical protein